MQFWKSHTFQYWLLGYLIILMFPFLSGLIYYDNMQQKLESKTYGMSQIAINQAGGVIDEKLRMVCSIGDSIYMSSEIKRIKLLSLPYSASDYFEIHKRAEYLSSFSLQYDIFKHVYVYYSDMNCLLDAQHIYTELNNITGIIQNEIHMDVDTFTALAAQSYYNQLMMLDDGTVLFLRTLSTRGNEKQPIITLVCVVNTELVRKVLRQTAQNEKGSAYIISPTGTAIGTVLGDGTQEQDTDIIGVHLDVNSLSNSVKTVTTTVESSISEFQYLLSIPNDEFLIDISTSRRIFFGTSSIALLLGILFTYSMTVHNYRPLHTLKQRINANGSGKDDFALIDTKLTELLMTENDMQNEIIRLDSIASSVSFDLLLTGHVDELEPLQRQQIHFTGNVFVAVFLCSDDTEDGQWMLTGPKGSDITESVLSLLLNGLCRDSCEFTIRKVNDGNAVLLCFPKGTDPIEAQLSAQRIINLILDNIKKRFNSPALRAYIGNANEEWEGIHRSYENARLAREYAYFSSNMDKQAVLFDQTMDSTDVAWKGYNIRDAEKDFICQMQEGQYAKGEQTLHEIMSYYNNTDGMSLYVLRCRMFGLMNMMLGLLHDLEPDLKAEYYENCSPVEMLLATRTLDELNRVMFIITRDLVGNQETKFPGNRFPIEQIHRYIANHYDNISMSVQKIADEYGMSLPCLSRAFKKEYGMGLLEYINRYRVNKAKEFIRDNSDDTIAAIAQKIGFNSSQTLIRVFKRYESMTPGQYKASISQNP